MKMKRDERDCNEILLMFYIVLFLLWKFLYDEHQAPLNAAKWLDVGTYMASKNDSYFP